MSYISSQFQKISKNNVNAGSEVIFDTSLLETSQKITYDYLNGIFTISEYGLYYIDWWVSTQATLSNEVSFAIKTSNNKIIKGNSQNLNDQVVGNAVLNISKTDLPFTFSLVNSTNQIIYYSQKTSVSANIVITEVGELLENLEDGNSPGSVRGINTATNYMMGIDSMAIGNGSIAKGDYSFAQGDETISSATASHAEGKNTTASGATSHSEGFKTISTNSASHAEGYITRSQGLGSHSEGNRTVALGDTSHAEGLSTTASGISAHAEGRVTVASGNYSHAEGDYTTASGEISHAQGSRTQALAQASHAEGSLTVASGGYSHAEGDSTLTIGLYSHAEGRFTKAIGSYSHAEGESTTAQGDFSHSEGRFTVSSGYYSHAQGLQTTASGESSTTFGEKTIADSRNSFAVGLGNSTSNIEGAFIIGKYGEAKGLTSTTGPSGTTGYNDGEYGFFIGNGTNANNKGLAAAILSNGALFIDGGVNTPASDYAEMYETNNNEFIDVGYFVTFAKGDKIRKTNKEDEYILGITSSVPGVIGNSACLRWKDKYITDEWGRVKYSIEEKDGNLKSSPIINPKWDSSKEYVSRINRDEWVAVGLLGQLRVRDNGKCNVDGYCKPGDEGIAIPSEVGYKVLKRVNANQIIVQFK